MSYLEKVVKRAIELYDLGFTISDSVKVAIAELNSEIKGEEHEIK